MYVTRATAALSIVLIAGSPKTHLGFGFRVRGGGGGGYHTAGAKGDEFQSQCGEVNMTKADSIPMRKLRIILSFVAPA
jgi:hypothetical protein